VLVAFLCVVVARYALLMWFAWLQHVEHMTEPFEAEEYPFVTIIVPAYNEGKVILSSVRSLMEMDYPHFEVLVSTTARATTRSSGPRAWSPCTGRRGCGWSARRTAARRRP
jgi:cellulose synthase/poly-beta-1,6-N-acetylglucosamine synthase-like glycosyltransferase